MSEKNYYYVRESAFNAFLAGQESKATLKDALEAVQSSGVEPTEDDAIVIFEKTNTIRKRKPRPIKSEFVLESNRKLGKREKKEGEATETTSTEGGEVAPKRRGRKPASEAPAAS